MPSEVEGKEDPPPPKRSKRTSKEPIRYRRDIGYLGKDDAEDKPSSAQQPCLARKKKVTKEKQLSSEESEENSFDDPTTTPVPSEETQADGTPSTQRDTSAPVEQAEGKKDTEMSEEGETSEAAPERVGEQSAGRSSCAAQPAKRARKPAIESGNSHKGGRNKRRRQRRSLVGLSIKGGRTLCR